MFPDSVEVSSSESAISVAEELQGVLSEIEAIETARPDTIAQIKFTRPEIAMALGLPFAYIKETIDAIIEHEPDLFSLGERPEDADVLYCNWKVLHQLSSEMPPPENMVNIEAFARLVGFDVQEVEVEAKRMRRTRPLEIRPHKTEEGMSQLFLSESSAALISQSLRSKHQRGKEKLNDNSKEFEEFADEMRKGLTLDAQELTKLIELLGPEYATDLVFHYRPNLSKIPVEYVKSFLADFLGDFTITRSNPDFERLPLSSELLSTPSLRGALFEVIKQDCLATYHRTKRLDPIVDDFTIIAEYLDTVRERFVDLSDNQQLSEVIGGVEEYYLSLFIDFDLPENIIDNLTSDRPFPDLNQRINIKEIQDKKRLLIADDPGLGKSASAILAKEKVGARLAVVVAPSGVIEKNIWQTYLSDEAQKGYFKEGMAPQVLYVSNPASLDNISPDDWDYILISHEKLSNEVYGEMLGKVGFDMLIIDEAHLLNNITDGKRANQLIQLSDHLLKKKNTYTVMLTATPAPNKVSDIAMALRVLYPDKLAKFSNKELAFLMINGGKNGEARDIRDLRGLLAPRLQMKTLEDSVDIPMLSETTEYVELSEAERTLYELLVEDDEMDFSTKMQACRKVLLNPAALDVFPHISPSKAIKVGERLQKAFETKDKILMFVNDFVTDIIRGNDSIANYFELPPDVEVRFIHGDVSERTRNSMQQEFQTNDKKMLLVVSGKTSGVGVDLSAAEELIFYNEGWTLSEKRQEIGRSQRPGRTQPLKVRTYIAGGTIEEGIHDYIERKDKAIQKLLRGVPLTGKEKDQLLADEESVEPDLDVNPELANHYFNATQRIDRMFGRLKQQGEATTRLLFDTHGKEYAETYKELAARSYQANMSRLAGTVIEKITTDTGHNQEAPVILDLGSGPEMLKRHMPEQLANNIISLDINANHFNHERPAPQNTVGSVVKVPVRDKAVDVVNVGLVLDSTKYRPSKRDTDPEALERLEIFKEMNRVLKPGGKAVITQIYSLDFTDIGTFKDTVAQLGFRVIEEYSGLVYGNNELRGRVVTLEKLGDCPSDMPTLVNSLDNKTLSGLKFAKRDSHVKNPKKIDRLYQFDNGTTLLPSMNERDKAVAAEEEKILTAMQSYKEQYAGIKNIPAEVILQGGLSRIRLNGRGNYTLFKRLASVAGAVFIKDH